MKVQTNPCIKVSVQNYPDELHVPRIGTSLHLSLSFCNCVSESSF